MAKFIVSGFGQDKSPVDVGVDLLIILEQVPEAINLIHSGNYPFELDFYERGVERKLEFVNNDDLVKITCSIYHQTWLPKSIHLTEVDIISQLLNLKESFLQAATKVYPQLAESNLFST